MIRFQDLPRYPIGGKDSSEDDVRCHPNVSTQHAKIGFMCFPLYIRWASHLVLSPGAARVEAAHAHAAAAAHVQYPASYAVALSAPANNVSPLAEYDVEGSGNSGSEDSDAPFARADAAAAAAASAASGGSPSTDAVPSGDGGVADEEEGEGDEPEDEDDDGEVGGSYSDVDGDSDPEDSAIRCVTFDALDGRSLTKPSGTK